MKYIDFEDIMNYLIVFGGPAILIKVLFSLVVMGFGGSF